MVIEIVSLSSRHMDEGLKFKLCEREKVKYSVLVYPDERMVKGREKRDRSFSFEECKVDIKLEEVLI